MKEEEIFVTAMSLFKWNQIFLSNYNPDEISFKICIKRYESNPDEISFKICIKRYESNGLAKARCCNSHLTQRTVLMINIGQKG